MNKIYFFNAANFSFAEIDLRKRNIFFVGDNGSGKTTAIRAIHFFYNSDVKSLGIDPNKESFKEFYFKYDNSFIVYEFEDYFVLMYKSSGNINRIFVRGKFELDKVLQNDEVKPMKEVLKYARENGFMVRTNEEFKKIIYGVDTRKLDFKIATIKNYNTFINLYNKIFNVNRAVFDAKSIKETIFTTLDRAEMGEIDYESFANELTDYRHFFSFYRKFKNKEQDIEKLYIYKNALLRLQEEMEELLEKIAYKKEIEEKELQEVLEEIKNLEEKLNYYYKQAGYFNDKIRKLEKQLNKGIFELNAKLEEINKLKNIYTLLKIQEAQKKVAQKEEIEKKIIELKTTLNELIKGIKSEVDTIEEEIERLKREKRILKDKLKEEEIRIKRNLSEIYEEKFEKIKEEFNEKESVFLERIDFIEKEIVEIEGKKETLADEKRGVFVKFREKEESLREEIENEKRSLLSKKRELINEKEVLKDEIAKLKREVKKLQESFEEEKEKLQEEFDKKFSEIEKKRNSYKEILKTTPNSFKEFLNEHVENWEEELYPVIDEELLSKSVDELKPRIVSDKVFGIELDKSGLKRIPTMKEAEEKLQELDLLEKSLKDEFETKLILIEKDFNAKKIEIVSKIEVNEEKIKEIDLKIQTTDTEIKKLKEKLNDALKELERLKKDEIRLIDINLKNLDSDIKKKRAEVEELKREIKKLKKELNRIKEELKKEEEIEFKQKLNELKREFKEKEKIIDEKIDELNLKKEKISRDERVSELNYQIKAQEEKLKEIKKAEVFLKEWEDKKEFIEKENKFKEDLKKCEEYLKRIDEFYIRLSKRIEAKIKETKKLTDEMYKRVDLIKEGLKEVRRLEIPDKKKKTNEYLAFLIKEYRKKEGEFSDSKRILTDSANNIKISLSSYAIEGLDVNFNLENLGNLVKEELEKVDELYLFKDKKFDVLSKTRIKGLKNLIGGIVEKKIDSFKEAKDDFLRQVRRINENLKSVNFGIVRDIKIEIEEANRSILKIFDEIREHIEKLLISLESESLFFDSQDNNRRLKRVEELFSEIKKEVKAGTFSLIDVIDISVRFIENEKENYLKVIKNESSTGGSILLKIAIAVSLLELFIKEKANLFLILDEVSVLSTKNQKLLKDFVNERGLGVIYVTPDLPLVDVEDIDIYKFRNVGGEFEVVKLIGEGGIKVEA